MPTLFVPPGRAGTEPRAQCTSVQSGEQHGAGPVGVRHEGQVVCRRGGQAGGQVVGAQGREVAEEDGDGNGAPSATAPGVEITGVAITGVKMTGLEVPGGGSGRPGDPCCHRGVQALPGIGDDHGTELGSPPGHARVARYHEDLPGRHTLCRSCG